MKFDNVKSVSFASPVFIAGMNTSLTRVSIGTGGNDVRRISVDAGLFSIEGPKGLVLVPVQNVACFELAPEAKPKK